MRQFAEFWQPFLFHSPTASKLDIKELSSEIEYDRFALAKWSPMASEINRDEFLGISFSHHMEILHKTKNIQEVLCCIHEAVVHQWDKYTLRDMLKAGIPQPEHSAPNNFAQTMPTARAAMKAIRMFKDEYLLDYNKPMGVSTYKTLSDMPTTMRDTLPDVEEMMKLMDDDGQTEGDDDNNPEV